jgi:hypothetical protein
MRKLFLAIVSMAVSVCFWSCKEGGEQYLQQKADLRDSIFAAYPTTVASITIELKTETELNVILGGDQLYKSTPTQQQKMAGEVGSMALRIFGKDNYLKTGKLTLTKDERNLSTEPADGVSTNINLDSLKKVKTN